ncbi:MAG: methyltransferase type 12, partial [Verrucomicrobiales bacterium VVV1]
MKTGPDSFDALASAYEGLERLAFGSDLETARFWHLDRLRDCRQVLVLGEGDGRFLARLLRQFPTVRGDCVEARGANAYDAVTTLFFLDCFTAEDVAGLIVRVTPSLRARAIWLWSDFALPAQGWRRWRGRIWLEVLYGFFRFRTGLSATMLPPAERLLDAAGYKLVWTTSLQAGLLRSAVFNRLP